MKTQPELKTQYERWISSDYRGDDETQGELREYRERHQAEQTQAQAYTRAVGRDWSLNPAEELARLVALFECQGIPTEQAERRAQRHMRRYCTALRGYASVYA
jgi:hypothetical protein